MTRPSFCLSVDVQRMLIQIFRRNSGKICGNTSKKLFDQLINTSITSMFPRLFFASIALFALPLITHATSPDNDFRFGIIGTGFVYDSGSSMFSYKILIDYRIHGRHTVELKFVHRSNDEEIHLPEKEEAETVMVNCTRRTYTTDGWLKDNENNYGYKQYQNGDVVSWDYKDEDVVSWDYKSEKAYAYQLAPSGNKMLPLYLKMVCDSL